MLRNYLLVTFRSLFKHRIFIVINILSLGIALAICVVAYFNYMFGYEFDRMHENFDNIYRINSMREMHNGEEEYGSVPATLGLELKKDIAGIYKAARLMTAGCPVKKGEDIFYSRLSFIDPEFLEIFTFPLISGNNESLNNYGNVLISGTMSKKLFGNADPVGMSISVINEKNKEFIFTVGGVFADLPKNSSFTIDVLLHYDHYLQLWEKQDIDWKLNTTAIFIEVINKSDLPFVRNSLEKYISVQNNANEDFKIRGFHIVPLCEVGKNSRYIRSAGLYPSLHPAAALAPPVLAFLILLIACFNFANTTLSSFRRRLKEIGLRKTFGGQKKQLVFQFMLETMIVCTMALITGIVLAGFLVPAYGKLWSYMSLQMELFRYPSFWIYLLLLLLFTGFITGTFPALQVSSMSPVKIIKGISSFNNSGKLSIIFLCIQITISVMTLIMGLVFVRNANYQKSFDVGYDKSSIIVVPVVPELLSSFRNEIIDNPEIISTSTTKNHIGFSDYRKSVKGTDKQMDVIGMDIGAGYAGTMGLKLVKGRGFDESRAHADRVSNLIVVNEKLVNEFGWKEPVGQTVMWNDTVRLTVIGVVKDFCLDGVWEKIEPVVLRLSYPDQDNVLVIRTNKANTDKVIKYLYATWKQLFPNYIFRGQRQEDLMQEEINVNRSIVKMNFFLALTAIILSLLGLYSLVSLDVVKRTREMGIRKILGASVFLIMILSGRKFLIVLAIGTTLGCYTGYYLSSIILKSLWDYHTNVGFQEFFAAITIMFVATVFTIIFKIGGAAIRNPAESLRYE